jgi:serine/threonine protein kinase
MGWNELIGHELEHYEILAELGRGGSSRVYKAFDTRKQLDVAIKVIPNDADDRQTFVHRFEREVEAVQKLHHPNIVAVFDSGETDELVYLVMQCVTGGTLRRRLKDRMSMRDAIAYIIQMAEALQHAHEQGIIHRDVKPSNMLLDAEHPEHLLLTDFGIAKIQGARQLTKSGTTIGTPEYMSPEQAEGREIDQRADIYALGCVLYEALAGRPPFTGVTPVSVLYQQVHSRPAYIRGFNPQVPRNLAQILELTLSKRPEDRYPTSADFAAALYPFLTGELEGMILPGRLPAAPTPASDMVAFSPASVPIQELPAVGGPEWPVSLPEEHEIVPLGGATAEAQPAPGAAPAALNGNEAVSGESSATRKRRQTVPLTQFRLPAKMRKLPDILPPDGWENEPTLPSRFASSATAYRAAHTAPETPTREHVSSTRTPIPAAYTPWNGSGNRRASRNDRRVQRSGRGQNGGIQPSQIRVGIAIVSCLLVLLIAWIAISASGLGVTLRPHSTPTALVQATTQPTATTQPSPTATTTPKPTATTDPQRHLNALAAADFRAVTLATFNDGSCSAGNSRTHFSSGQLIYANICTSGSASSTRMTVTIRQGGRVVRTMASNFAFAPGAHYYFYTTSSNLGTGSFELVVTAAVQGGQGVARDIGFTIG